MWTSVAAVGIAAGILLACERRYARIRTVEREGRSISAGTPSSGGAPDSGFGSARAATLSENVGRASDTRAAIAVVNEELSEVAAELGETRVAFGSAARVSLFSGTLLSLLSAISGLQAPTVERAGVAWDVATSALPFVLGAFGAAGVHWLGLRAEASARRAKDNWNRLGKALLRSAGPAAERRVE